MTYSMIGTAKKRFSISDKFMHPRQHDRSFLWEHRFSIVVIMLCQNTIRRVPIRTNGCSIPRRLLCDYINGSGFPGFLLQSFWQIPLVFHDSQRIRSPWFCYRLRARASVSRAAKESIIHLDHTIQHVLGIPLLESSPDFVDHKPCGLVMDFKKSLQQGGGTTPLVNSYQIDGPEPLTKRNMRTVKHGVCSHRRLVPTVFTLKYFPLLNKVCLGITTSGTMKTISPSYIFEMLETLFFRSKEFLELENSIS